MMDAEYSDDEHYANESFENESDTEVPEMSEFESESTENSGGDDDDEDDENLPSVKLNTGPIKRNNSPNNITNINKTDVVPFDSSSEEEDEVIVGQTLAEINTLSMVFEGGPPTPAAHRVRLDEHTKESSEEISEEEDDEEEEYKKIKEMEEKYLQQISAKTQKAHVIHTESLDETEQINNENPENEALTESEDEAEAEEEQEYVFEEENALVAYQGENPPDHIYEDKSFKTSCSSRSQEIHKDNTTESIDQNKLIRTIQNSLINLNIPSSNDNEENLLQFCQASLLNEIKAQTVEMTNIMNPEKIVCAVVNALQGAGLNNLEDKNKQAKALENNQEVLKEFREDDTDAKRPITTETNDNNSSKKIEIVPYQDDLEEEKEKQEEERNAEIEEIENNNNYDDDDHYIYYDAHITSKTPSSFNSDDYIFHANFIKQIHPTSSTDKLRPKPYPRKSMSFSNERMREIERHNQILLRKILSKKPTYTLKSKSSQSSLEKLPSQTNTRLTTSAVNRKKQQRQIDLDNQVLKRKIEAIALRRRPFIT